MAYRGVIHSPEPPSHGSPSTRKVSPWNGREGRPSARRQASCVSRETLTSTPGRHRRIGILEPPPFQAAAPTQGTQISYTGVLLALIAGIAHAAIAPVVVIGGVRPNLVLIVVVLVAVMRGFGPGVAWAFVAGLSANLLGREPLGSIPLALLLLVVIVAAGGRVFGRMPWVYPVAAVFIGSFFADVVALGVLSLVDLPLQGGIPFDLLLPAALLNAGLAGLALYPARLLLLRLDVPDQPSW